MLADDGTISKPRTIAWERLFFGAGSPLREHIRRLSDGDGVPSPIQVTPSLEFRSSTGDRTGSVEKLEVSAPASVHAGPESFREIGSALAYFLWFGMTDLHDANVAFGADSAGRLIFGPVDVECVFQECYLPSQAQLLPARAMRPEDAGLAKVLEFARAHAAPDSIASICGGFWEAARFFERHDRELTEHFHRDGLPAQHVRIILRNTRDYHAILKGMPAAAAAPLTCSEKTQLDRGDIPYFFRRFSESEALYYSGRDTIEDADIPSERLQDALGWARIPGKDGLPSRRKAPELFRYGALQLAGYFDPGEGLAEFQSGSAVVRYGESEFSVQDGGEFAVGSKRRTAPPLSEHPL